MQFKFKKKVNLKQPIYIGFQLDFQLGDKTCQSTGSIHLDCGAHEDLAGSLYTPKKKEFWRTYELPYD